MKLSIAVGGILSARSTLHSGAQAAIDPTSVSRRDGHRALLNLLSAGTNKGFGSKKQPSSRTGSTPSATSTGTRSSSSRVLEDERGAECDYEASAADVGVLVCGSDAICVENVDSSMGGFCYLASSFGIFNACDPSSVTFDAACDCSAFNVENKTGNISCPYGNKNMGVYYYGCYDVIEHITLMASFQDNMYTSRGSCAEFVAGGDVTKSTKVCTTLDTANGNPIRFDGASCEVQIDGQVCTSCLINPHPALNLSSEADCSNVVEGLMIAVYYHSLLPIIQSCYDKPIDGGTFCSLCSDTSSAYIPLSGTTAISLDGFGSNFTCELLSAANRAYQISSDKCPEASAVAQAECCPSYSSPAPSSSEPTTAGPVSSPTPPSTSAPMSPASPASALSLVSAGILLIGTSFMLAMN